MNLKEEIKFESKKYKISILGDLIIRAEVFKDAEITMEDLELNLEIYNSFLNGRKMLFLLVMGEFSMMNLDTQKKYALRDEQINFKLKEAAVIRSLPMKILGNFHLKFFKPGHPSKIFKSEEEAIKWLLEGIEKDKV